MSVDSYLPGQFIVLTDDRHAVIRFVGNTHFAPGDWVGVELEDATGKNDGSVQGERYFTCRPNFGMFVRPVAVAGVVRPPPMPAPYEDTEDDDLDVLEAERPGRRSPGIPEPRSRKSSMNSASSRSNRMNIAVPPTSSAPSAPVPTSSVTTTAPRPTMAIRSPASANSSSDTQPNIGLPLPKSSGLPKFPLRSQRSSSSHSSARVLSSQELSNFRPVENIGDIKTDSRNAPNSKGRRKVSGQSVLPSSADQADSPPQPNQRIDAELEDLRTTVRLLKKKREEDKSAVNECEMLRLDKQKFEAIIQKLQPKIQSQKQEIGALRRDLQEMQSYMEEAQHIQSEHDSMLEMAAVDREMAEEMAETIKAEQETLKKRMEELELEVEILREENQELYKGASPEDKASTAWVQMEKTNDRLREALVRLREMTQQQETELRGHVKELETDLEDYSALKADYEVVREALHVSESNVEELKQQIEALGAEDFMIEELSEKNMQYQEDITQLKSMIQDLESLRELSDELEVNHTETEKQMQDEIDHMHGLCNDQRRRIAEQDKALADSNYTNTKFRELVSTLHNDLENMRATQQISDSESNLLTARSKAMTDLNLKLHAFASKTQMTTIDVELSRLEAEESSQQLAIVKHYLPDYFETEKNPILTFLRFRRIRFKSSLIIKAVKEWVTEEGSLDFEHDNTFVALNILDKSTLISLLCDRFIDFISHCSGDEFLTLEGASYELEPVERNLNRWIETLRKNELDGEACSVELERSVSLIQHLSAALIPKELRATANDIFTAANMSQMHLDNATTALTRLKDVLEAKMKANESDSDSEEALHIFKRLEALLDRTRSRKVVSVRITRSLEELKSRCLILTEGPVAMFEKAEHTSKDLVKLARLAGTKILAMFKDYERTEQPSLGDIVAVFSEISAQSDEDHLIPVLTAMNEKLLTLTGLFEEIVPLSSDLSQTVEFERHVAPWIKRSSDLKTVKLPSQESEAKILRLQASLNEITASVAFKDKTLEEQGTKIELLESRMRDSSKRTASFQNVQKELQDLKAEHQKVLDVVAKQSQDIQGLEQVQKMFNDSNVEKSRPRRRSTVSTAAFSTDKGVTDDGKDAQATAALTRDNDHLRAEVASLQSVVRYLNEENRRANCLGDIYTIQRNNSLRSWIDSPLTNTSESTKKKRTRHSDALECGEMLSSLLKLAKNFSVADIRKSHCPADQTASPPPPPINGSHTRWRPVRLTTKYHGIRQKEQYEEWMQWKDEVISKGQERLRLLKLTKSHLFSGHQDAILKLRDASSWRSVQSKFDAPPSLASKDENARHGIEEDLAEEFAVTSLGNVEIVQPR